LLYSHYISPVKSCKYKTLRISKLSGIFRSCARRLSEIPVDGRLAMGGEKGVDLREGTAAEKAAVGAGRFAGVAGKCTRSLDFRECFIKSRTAYLR
jgi:hypothetical protein